MLAFPRALTLTFRFPLYIFIQSTLEYFFAQFQKILFFPAVDSSANQDPVSSLQTLACSFNFQSIGSLAQFLIPMIGLAELIVNY
jgi:hypothetical protein